MSYVVSDFSYNDTIHDEKHHDMHITCMMNSLIINKLSKQIRDQLQYNIIPPKIYTTLYYTTAQVTIPTF